jgi:hypothetical protein
MRNGEVRSVNLFNAGPLHPAALAFGRVNMLYHGNNLFSIVSDGSARFDFSPIIDQNASLGRDVGNVFGALINCNIPLALLLRSPIPVLLPILLGGPYNVNFTGSVNIKK